MRRPLLTILLLAAGALPAAAQTDYVTTVATGGLTAAGTEVRCDPASCFEGLFLTTPGRVASVTGVADDGATVFSGWAEGWHSGLLTLHGGAGLAVSSTGGSAGDFWFANSSVAISTTLVSTWAGGGPGEIRLTYRFEGSTDSWASGAASVAVGARVQAAIFGQQAIACTPLAGAPGLCEVVLTDRVSGEVFGYDVALLGSVRVQVLDGGVPYTAHGEADFRHTLTWVGAGVYDLQTGAPLTDWTLATADDGVVIFSSPVPEPPAALLGALGLAALALRRRRYST